MYTLTFIVIESIRWTHQWYWFNTFSIRIEQKIANNTLSVLLEKLSINHKLRATPHKNHEEKQLGNMNEQKKNSKIFKMESDVSKIALTIDILLFYPLSLCASRKSP